MKRFISLILFVICHLSFVISWPTAILSQSPLGNVALPPGVNKYGSLQPGLANFITAILRTLIVIGSIYFLLNIILAGYQYMSAANDPKRLQASWAKIWQSLVGLLLMVASFLLAAIFGYILFGDPMYILQPRIYVP